MTGHTRCVRSSFKQSIRLWFNTIEEGNTAVIKQLDEMSKEELYDELHHAHRWLSQAEHEVDVARARINVINMMIRDRSEGGM